MPTIRPPIEPPTAALVAVSFLIMSGGAEEVAVAAAVVDTLLGLESTAGSLELGFVLDGPDDDPDCVDDVSRAL
jgi:hypothetical protein